MKMSKYNMVIGELTNIGAVKVIMPTYDEAWLLRNHINNELRRQGLKELYTSAVMDTMLIMWKIELYGKKGSKYLVADMLDACKILPLTMPDSQVIHEDPDIGRIFKELKKEDKQAEEKRIKDIVDKLGS